jgi:hypothetical protein
MKLPKRGSGGLSGSGPSEVFVSNSQEREGRRITRR